VANLICKKQHKSLSGNLTVVAKPSGRKNILIINY